jgi:hypothetical protein
MRIITYRKFRSISYYERVTKLCLQCELCGKKTRIFTFVSNNYYHSKSTQSFPLCKHGTALTIPLPGIIICLRVFGGLHLELLICKSIKNRFRYVLVVLHLSNVTLLPSSLYIHIHFTASAMLLFTKVCRNLGQYLCL